MRKYTKIIVTEKHNIEKINSIVNTKKPKKLVLESSSRRFNLKTQWLAHELIGGGWSENQIKLSYKGNLFKVVLSNDNPVDARDAEGFLSGPAGSKLTAVSRDEA